MNQSISQPPPEFAIPLRRFVLRRRTVAMLRAVAIALLIALLWLLAWGVVDRFVPLSSGVRTVLLTVLMLVMGIVVRRPVGSVIAGKIDWTRAARQYELHDNRFGQALVTVVSESLAPGDLRGSPQITAYLAEDVKARLRRAPVGPIVDLRPALRAWFVAAMAGFLIAAMAFWPWLDLPKLLLRQVAPFTRTGPVTRSQVSVRPGTAQVLYGADLPIIARVQIPGSEGVILRTTTDGINWNSTSMGQGQDGSYTRILSALSRDTRYEVRTGDAVAGPYSIRVLHHPVVRELSFRFEYPSYVDREPLTILYGGEPIEAPAGTRVRITVAASEELRSAWFTLNDQRLPTLRASEPNARYVEFEISSDTQVGLEMVSERGVPGTGPPDLMIRAIQDRQPFAQLRVPPGMSFAGPGSVLSLPYDAFDDYAIASLRARVDVDGMTRGEIPLPIGADPHRLEGSIRLNLADWNVQPGQMIATTLVASDRSGKTTESPVPSRVLVSGQSVLPEDRQRIAELRTAARLSGGVRAELESARLVLDASRQTPPDERHAPARLALAAERATRLMISLLVVSNGVVAEPERRLIESLIDSAQVQASRLEMLNAQSTFQRPDELRQGILELQREVVTLDESIRALWLGQAAQLILAERSALAGVAERRMPDMDRLREEIDAEVQEIGLEPRIPDLDQQLRLRVDQAQRLPQEHPPVDLLAIAGSWSRRSDPRLSLLPERLAAAARVEAVRPDADPARVRDLQLASRAARAVEAFVRPPPPDQATPREQFVAMLGLLFREQESRRTGAPAGAGVDVEQVRGARQVMSGWAGEAVLVRSESPTTQSPSRAPATRSAVAGVPPVSETRDQGMAVIGRSLELLTEMPKMLYELEQTTRVVRAARNRLDEARAEADAALPDERPAAQRAIAAQQETVRDDLEHLSEFLQTIDFTQPIALAGQLRRYLPDTAPAIEAVESIFSPAMASLYDAIDKQDMEEIDQWITESRRSIAVVQQALRDSRATMLARDPTVIARTFAATTRPSTQGAFLIDSLRGAWDDPLRSFINPQLLPQQSPGLNSAIATTQPARPAPPVPLRPWRSDELSVLLRDDDPPQYRDALNIYFQVLEASNSQDR